MCSLHFTIKRIIDILYKNPEFIFYIKKHLLYFIFKRGDSCYSLKSHNHTR